MSRLRSVLGDRGRPDWPVWATVAAVGVVCAILFVAATGATLSPSTFEGNDGNMTVDKTGNTDWVSLGGKPALRTLIDRPSGSDDNAFGQGTKEDDTSVTVVTGSIPPNKNDLTRSYLYNEQAGGSSFLYLAWERAAAIGDAHIDFELNQHATQGFDSATVGDVTLNRTPGDLLIAYDFGGSGAPDITLFKWDGTQWSDQQDLSAEGFAEAAVNAGPISDVLNGGAGVGAGEFGEASVNLSSALIAAGFSPDTCQAFGSVTVKARSSGSSTSAELKDFIAPVPIQVSSCPTPAVSTKLSESTGSVGDTVRDSATLTGATADAGGTVTYSVYTDSSCSQDKQDAGTVDVTNGSVPHSDPITFDSAGTWYWRAVYSGDGHNNGAASACTDEQLVIAPNRPSIRTTLSESTGLTGDTVHDSAALTDATAGAGGTVTYSVYSNSSCTSKVADGGTVAVTDGSVPDSNDVTFGTPGTYYWQASYSGDANNMAAVSTCTDEALVISPPTIDLAVTKVGSPNPDKLPGDITWTMVVTNNGPETAHGVTIADPIPAGNTFVKATTTQGSCTGGEVLSCNIGTMAPGASVTIILITTPSEPGTVTNTVTVVGNETETNYANNTATATVLVVSNLRPPKVYCVAVSRITPKQLYVGRRTTLTIYLTRHRRPVAGIRVHIKGPKLNVTTRRSNSRGVITRVVNMKKAGIMIFTPVASKRCNTKRVGVTGVFTPPVTG